MSWYGELNAPSSMVNVDFGAHPTLTRILGTVSFVLCLILELGMDFRQRSISFYFPELVVLFTVASMLMGCFPELAVLFTVAPMFMGCFPELAVLFTVASLLMGCFPELAVLFTVAPMFMGCFPKLAVLFTVAPMLMALNPKKIQLKTVTEFCYLIVIFADKEKNSFFFFLQNTLIYFTCWKWIYQSDFSSSSLQFEKRCEALSVHCSCS